MSDLYDRLLRQDEVAKLLSVSEAWLEQCRFRRIGIEYIKVGRSVRYRESAVLAYLEKQRVSCH